MQNLRACVPGVMLQCNKPGTHTPRARLVGWWLVAGGWSSVVGRSVGLRACVPKSRGEGGP